MGLAAITGGAIALPAAAHKAGDQRADVVSAQLAADFHRMPFPQADTPTVARLTDLYGPDSSVDSPLQRARFDLGSVETDPKSIRVQSEAEMAEAKCLTEAIYYESRSESRSGQVAVAQVIQNRVASKHYPNSICEVVYQGSERRTGCQFSFTCDGSMDKRLSQKSWERSADVARYVLTQDPDKLIGRSTHYHTDYVDPRWNRTLVRTKKVGSHIFYRFPFTERPVATASMNVAPPA
ncbi:MAG: cell wall hydrolase [Litorimonas sp.]